ncbi:MULTISPECIES: hypothetical protein [Streptacidiphilus]|uniref:Uncharacterized protein n=1 Tax=Streptacidiphilus cavernicola TaxID=3342716 RepID=A0ABV6UW50_9ACTN|nr:hypothetical protein [Streptacidiphilus jeojiense]
MDVTVPTVPHPLHPAACWRKILSDLDPAAEGGYAVIGQFLNPGDVIDTLPGTLLLTVDKATTGWADNYHGSGRHRVEDATVTVHLVTDDTTNPLKELWSRHYKSSKSAFGASTIKKLTTLLAKHPAPPTNLPVEVIREAQRPALASGTCRWCENPIPKGTGHRVGRGDDTALEHYQKCPERRAATGTPCALCGVTVIADQARQVLIREFGGHWQTEHRADGLGFDCRTCDIMSAEDQIAEQQMIREQEAAKAAKAAARKEAARVKREEKKARETARDLSERQRVSRLTPVSTERRELYNKGLGPGRGRAILTEYTDVYADGTRMPRWTVDALADSTEYTDLAIARAYYQDYKYDDAYEDSARTAPAPRAAGQACPTPHVKHCGHCGGTESDGGWMVASLGLACDVDCYTAMADARGRHDRRYHPYEV